MKDYSGFHHKEIILLKLLPSNFFYDFNPLKIDDLFIENILKEKNLQENKMNEASWSHFLYLWKKEFQLNKQTILFYPGHETLWYYR